MSFPQPPEKIVPFNSGPVAAHDIGRQFDEHQRATTGVIDFLRTVVRDDGRLKNGLIGPEQLDPKLPELLAGQAARSVEGLLASVRQSVSRAEQSAIEAQLLKEQLAALQAKIAGSADAMARASEEVRGRLEALNQLIDAPPAVTPTVPAGVLGPWSGDFYATDEESAAPLAQDYAQVSIEWAEHMPDTIPPNILAINAVTGDHWSSRWWANRSANAFGMLAWWYQGAWPGMPPSTPNTPTGQPLPIGSMFFNTTTGTMMVWNGSTWVNASAPQKGISASLYYAATSGQTVFPLGTVDRHGHNYAFSQTVPEGVDVYIDGAGRLEPQYDYTVDYPGSTITLIAPAAAGLIVTFDVLVPALALTPSGSANTMLLNPITPDGTTTSFTGLTLAATGAPVSAGKSEELYVSVDGVLQQPGTAYSAVAATITFLEAPAANSNIFMVWFGPPVLAGGGGGGGGAVSSVAGRTGDVILTHADITDWTASMPAAYVLPTASTSVLGGVKVDGSTVTISGGVISASGAGGGISDAPSDGQYYSRRNLAWAVAPGGLTDAPSDGTLYARKTGAWSHVTHTDITDWTTSLAPYALTTSVPAASSSTPVMDGTGAAGAGTTWARADHVHPSDTSRLSVSGGTLTGGLVVQGPADLKLQNIAAAATTSINRVNGENVVLTLGVAITSLAVSGWPAAGTTGKLRLLIANIGGNTIAWPAGTRWPAGTAPTLSASGKTDIVLLMTDDGGTTIYGSVVGQDYR